MINHGDHTHPDRPPGAPYHEHLPDDGFLVVLPGVLPLDLNRLLRVNRYERPRIKEEWKYMILAALGKHRPSYEHAWIEMTMYRIGGLDDDNKEGAFKIPGDAIKELRIIPDDKPKYIKTKIMNKQLPRKDRSQIRTEIRFMKWDGETKRGEE